MRKSSRSLTKIVVATATVAVAPVVATVRGVQAAVEATHVDEPQLTPAPVQPTRYLDPGPPQVEICGFRHQDVVRDVYRGWTGTVHHGRKITRDGDAVVRWSGSFAESPLRDVAHVLELIQRRR